MKKGFMFGGAFLPENVLKNFPIKNSLAEVTKNIRKTYEEIESKYGSFLAKTWFEQDELTDEFEKALNSTEAGPLYVTRVLYNNPVTIVFWNDGTKTSVRCSDQDTYCREAGLSMCVLKKFIGTDAFKNLFEDWMPEQYYDNLGDANAEVTMRDVRNKHNSEEN